jgi:membrane fusion protein (multidrug efflux system)
MGVLVVRACVAAWLALSAFGLIDARASDAPVPVRVAAAGPSANAGRIEAAGTLSYKREVALAFKTGGVVKAYTVDVGDPVRAGQLLVSADPTDVAGRRGEAEAAFAQAKANLERAEQLAAKGFASEARVDDATAAYKRAQSAMNSARYDESRSALTAPSDGVVLARQAEPGQQVAPGVPVITIGDARSGMIMVAPVSDRNIDRIQTGNLAAVRVASVKGLPLQGTVTRIGSKADRITGAFDVEIAIDAPPPGLRSGAVGTVSITPSIEDATAAFLAIPALALLEGRGDLAYVYVVGRDNKAVRVAVTIAKFLDADVLISQGLKRGDRVVTAGAAYLRNGQPVTIVAGGTP